MNRKFFARRASRPKLEHNPAFAPIRNRDLAFLRYLRAEQFIDDIALARATAAVTATLERTETLLIELGLIEESPLLKAMADYLSLQLIGSSQFPAGFPEEVAIDLDYLCRHGLVPLAASDQHVMIATAQPLNDDAARAAAFSLGKTLVLKLASSQDIQHHLSGWMSVNQAGVAATEPEDHTMLLDSDTQRLKDLASEAPVIRLLDRIVLAAADRRASDIHIEPLDDCVQRRVRVDGTLHPTEILERSIHLGLVSRVKILARLNIAENRLPQDGRIRIPVRGRNIDFRIATSPMLHGEGVVLRLLDRRDIELDLPKLGFPPAVHHQLDSIITQPNGIFVVTGPTGSGKTTTLYALLAALNKPITKIFTVEDPVEYHLRGINQIPVRAQIGLDFASILRSILRQDPDVIMIGEIRDNETARIAVQAALTGHLVLTTLHTNSAAASITRLRDLGIEDYLLASTLRGILAQRLVRTRCKACGTPDKTEGNAPGCQVCGQTGYHGRSVLCEAMTVSEGLRTLITKGASETEIAELARTDGMQSIREHSAVLVTNGITSSDEVIRVLGIAGL